MWGMGSLHDLCQLQLGTGLGMGPGGFGDKFCKNQIQMGKGELGL